MSFQQIGGYTGRGGSMTDILREISQEISSVFNRNVSQYMATTEFDRTYRLQFRVQSQPTDLEVSVSISEHYYREGLSDNLREYLIQSALEATYRELTEQRQRVRREREASQQEQLANRVNRFTLSDLDRTERFDYRLPNTTVEQRSYERFNSLDSWFDRIDSATKNPLTSEQELANNYRID